MMNTKLRKLVKGCALAMALAMTTGTISVYAAELAPVEENTIKPGETGKDTEATSRTGIDPTDTNASSETNITVWGYTKNTVVYSVDVEWGAMTFEYEASVWNPETHKKDAGGGWKIYDQTQEKTLEATQDAINRVTVTNHSNAPVYAQMSYAGTGDKAVADGSFAAIDTEDATDAGIADVKATWNDTNKYFTLKTAATDESDAAITDSNIEGTPSVGNVYFMPTSAVTADTTIDKWTTIGKINVAVTTTEPTATP